MSDYRRKLIEVALPLEAINREAAREKSIRHGHPSTLHLWWARRPLAACRAVLFSQLVDDPSSHPEKFKTEEDQLTERRRLFGIIERLVKWDNSNNSEVLREAREEILKSCGANPTTAVDPFCGGGSIPLEAQRLGLTAYASDLNPVAVLITKALVEMPPKFSGRAPVNPEVQKKLIGGSFRAAQGLADDVRYYCRWMRDEGARLIGDLYPKIKITRTIAEGREDLTPLVDQELTVIAWLWARTVECPNPACGGEMPLVRSFWLSTKKNSQAWVRPIVDQRAKTVRFTVCTTGRPEEPPKIGRGASFRCLICKQIADEKAVRAEFKAKRDGSQLMAVVAEGRANRIYLPPVQDQADAARRARPKWKPEEQMNQATPNLVSGRGYGIAHWHELFTSRQLLALTTFSDLIIQARQQVLRDALAAGMPDDRKGIAVGGSGATAYADALAMYLSFCIDKSTLTNCTAATWQTDPDRLTQAFSRQALPMTWDYAEANPFSEAGGGFALTGQAIFEVLANLPEAKPDAVVRQLDAQTSLGVPQNSVIATDPPYYDNIGYADLSDFFYVWLRRSIGKIFPDLFRTVLVPKSQELVAATYRFDDDKASAKQFFDSGLGRAFGQMRAVQNPAYPLTLFYAFKQAEAAEGGDDESVAVVSTGWETMLEGLLRAGFEVVGTWPMRTELTGNLKKNVGALASSILLVCRPRAESARVVTRKEFIDALREELPRALKRLQHGNIAPVDLAQAAIGPGMAVFSSYDKVKETDGSNMTVRTALTLINLAVDETLAEQEGEYDAETRWALAWFEQFGQVEGKFGDAETLSRAKDTAVNALVEAGIVRAKGAKVQLIPREKLNIDWDPASESRLTVWELTQQLIRALETGGEIAAARIVRRVGFPAESAKDLAYRLFVICDRKGWSQEALSYNMLVKSWPELQKLAASTAGVTADLSPSGR